jgi:septal ring factor EnvC (AmiA/AmiB activator)
MHLRPILLLILTPLLALAQPSSIQTLEQQKKQVESDIAYTNSLISQTKSEQQASLENLNLIQVNITSRKEMLANIDKQLVIIAKQIAERQKKVAELHDDLARLKDSYSKMLLFAYRNRTSHTQLMYILSSESVSQAYRRTLYLRTYSEHRVKQAQAIAARSEELHAELIALNLSKAEQEKLLGQKTHELMALDDEEKKYQAALQNLQAREKELWRTLDSKKRQAAKLNMQIESAIAEETRREIERRKAAEKKEKGRATKLLADEKERTAKFEKQRGRLPMPVAKGVITTHFGVHEHPIHKGIKLPSGGVEITTTDGTPVFVVAEGVVSRIFTTDFGTSVMVQHGQYYTVYTHLRSISVTAGDIVSAKQQIGLVTHEPDTNRAILDFQLWKQTTKQDPEPWLAIK